uniref:UBR-type domain-containing protein n=1 Tax=Mesocestoides corti TaxID=53468 RepID=A0A5K3EWD4_MESCO
VTDTEPLSQVVFNRLSRTPVECTSTPQSILIGHLLREFAMLAETLASRRRLGIQVPSPTSTEDTVAELCRLQLDPALSALDIQLTKSLDCFVSATAVVRERKKSASAVITKATEDCILSALIEGLEGESSECLRVEVFNYLEMATGVPRVLTRCVDDEPHLLARLFVPPASAKQIRLLNFILMRAINPSSNRDLFARAATQALTYALDNQLLSSALSHLTTNELSDRRDCILVERLLRLIATPWTDAHDLCRRCLGMALEQVESCSSCPVRGYFIVSGVRCLALASWNDSGEAHMRLAKHFAKWAEQAEVRMSVEAGERKNDLTLTLCAIYDYFGLLLRALASPSKPNETDTSGSLCLPDISYWQNSCRSISNNLKDPELSKFFNFFYSLGDDDDGVGESKCDHMRPGDGWNSALDRFMLQALCGPAGTHDEPDPLLSTAPFSHCSPLERVCEEVCTFASTQYQFIEQPWYGCYTCGMTSGRGVCHLCAQLCHAGHDLVFNTTGDFFCDCAAEFGVLGKCCSVTRRLGRHGVGQDGLFTNLLPWTNSACLQKSASANACDLIFRAATRAPVSKASCILANGNNTGVAVAESMRPVTPPVPPRLADASPASHPPPATTESGSSGVGVNEGVFASRIRRMGAMRRRSGALTSSLAKTVSRAPDGVGETPLPPVQPLPTLSVMYGCCGALGQSKGNLWKADDDAPRKTAVEAFRKKFGQRPHPHTVALINRVRIQLSSLNQSLQDQLVQIVQSPALTAASCRLLTRELGTLSVLKLDPFEDVFSGLVRSESLLSAAHQWLLSTDRSSSPLIRLTSEIMSPVLILNTESATSSSPSACELLAPPSSVTSSVTTTQAQASSMLSSSESVGGLNRPRTRHPAGVKYPNLLQEQISSVLSPRQTLLNSTMLSQFLEATSLIRSVIHHAGGPSGAMVAALARIPSVGGWRHYLLIGGGSSGPLASSQASKQRDGAVSVYALDDLFATAAECQDEVEEVKLKAYDGGVDSTEAAPLSASLQPFVVPLASLCRVSKLNCGFEPSKLSVHPGNEAIFAASNSAECSVVGLSSLGQACGRVTIAPLLEEKEEVLIKPVWLPNSCRFLCLLTTKSVQIFDIFASSPRLLFYFKPVEGKFCDATFVYAPKKKLDSSKASETHELSEDNDDFSDVYLFVMATFGSIMPQRLLPETRISCGQFYLADCLDWDPESLSSTGSSGTLQRNPRTGTLGGGGVSVFYSNTLNLLLHSYHSGHTVASSIDFGSDNVKVNHSFLLTDGSSSKGGNTLLETNDSTETEIQSSASTATWSGPLNQWSEVREHPGLLTATAVESSGGNRFQRRHLIVAVEPDTVLLQPLPVDTEPPLKRIDEVASRSPKNGPENDEKASKSSSVAISLTQYWAGTSELAARSFSLQISQAGTIQVLATPPACRAIGSRQAASAIDDSAETFASLHKLPPTLPGQFWLQPALRTSDATVKPTDQHLASETPSSPVALEDVLLWDMSSGLSAPYLNRPDYSKAWEFAAHAVAVLPILRHLLETTRPGTANGGDLAYDFHEWSTPSDNVIFYSRDLLSIYNQETLCQRLSQSNTPVTFAGRSLAYTLEARNADSRVHSALDKSDVVTFVVDITSSKPTEEVIVGLRVELADSPEAYYPRFLSVFGRVFYLNVPSTAAPPSMSSKPKTADAAGKNPKPPKLKVVDIPLSLHEMLNVNPDKTSSKGVKPIRLCVGRSNSADTLTSIDRIQVYTVPRAQIDPAVLVQQNMQQSVSESQSSLDHSLCIGDKESRIVTYNTSLVTWFDRLLATGFVTDLPSSKVTRAPCEFTSPSYDIVDKVEDVGGGGSGLLVSSLSEFFAAALSLKQCGIKASLGELQPQFLSSLTSLLPSVFTFPQHPTGRLIPSFINLLACHSGGELPPEAIVNPDSILREQVSDFVNQVTSSTGSSRLLLSASAKCLLRLSRIWQLRHEFGDGCASFPDDMMVSGLCDVLEKRLLFDDEVTPVLRPDVNAAWVELLQPLVKLGIFVLAESSGQELCGSSKVVSSLFYRLLTHPQSQIACNTRDLLCGALACLFSGNHRISSAFFEALSPPFEPGPKASLPAQSQRHQRSSIDKDDDRNDDKNRRSDTDGEGSKRRRLYLRSSQRRQRTRVVTTSNLTEASASSASRTSANDDDLDMLGREISELLQFFSSASLIGDVDDDDANISPRERRLAGALAHLQTLRVSVDELRRRADSGFPTIFTRLASGAPDPIRIIDDFSEGEDEADAQQPYHRLGTTNKDDEEGPNEGDEHGGNGGNADDDDVSVEDDDEDDESEGENADENEPNEGWNAQDTVTNEPRNEEDNANSRADVLTQDFTQFIMRCLQEGGGNGGGSGFDPAAEIRLPEVAEGLAQAQRFIAFDTGHSRGGGGSDGAMPPESAPFDASFLDNADEDTILNLALQLSLRDQGGPGTAALMGEQGEQSATTGSENQRDDTSGETESRELANQSESLSSFHTKDQLPVTAAASTVAATNASNSEDQETKPVTPMQLVHASTDSIEVARKASMASVKSSSSGLSDGILQGLFDNCEEVDRASDSSPCASWGFSSNLITSSSSSSSTSTSDDEDNRHHRGSPPSPPPPPQNNAAGPRDKLSRSAARACIVLVRYLSANWVECVENVTGESRRLVPLFQTSFTLCRLLEAAAQCCELNTEDWNDISLHARNALKDLLVAVATSLLRLHSQLQTPLAKPSGTSERLLLITNLFSRLLSISPSPRCAPLTEEQITISPAALLVSNEALGELSGSGAGDCLRAKCLDACLNIVKGSFESWEKDDKTKNGGESKCATDKNMSSSATSGLASASTRRASLSALGSLPQLTSGLLQCARGVNFSSLVNGYGAGLTSWAPIIDSHSSLSNFDTCHRIDFSTQLTEATVRLTIALCGGMKGDEEAALTTSCNSEELNSKWCSLAYNLLEVLTDLPEGKVTPYTSRLSALLRSLLVLLVGPKHYRQLKDIHLLGQMISRLRGMCIADQRTSVSDENGGVSSEALLVPPANLRLPYRDECSMLTCVHTCLNIALANPSIWQRLCIRMPANLLFMMSTSLCVRDPLARGLLNLVFIAVTSSDRRSEKQISVPPSASTKQSTKGGAASSSNYSKLAAALTQLLTPEEGEGKEQAKLFAEFLRDMVCCRADSRIRHIALGIALALYRHGHGAFRLALLQQLPQLWAELPNFAVYGDELAQLTCYLVVDQPLWAGRVNFLNQLVTLLTSQLTAISDHPKRDAYTALMRVIELGNLNLSVLPTSGSKTLRVKVEDLALADDSHASRQLSRHLTCDQLPSFPLELEPCLICHRGAFNNLPYALLQWGSSSPSRRRTNTSSSTQTGQGGTSYLATSYHARFLSGELRPMEAILDTGRSVEPSRDGHLTYAQAAAAAASSSAANTPVFWTPTPGGAPSFFATPSVSIAGGGSAPEASTQAKSIPGPKPMAVVDIEPQTWVSPNVHIFALPLVHDIAQIGVRFLPPNNALRFVRTLNVYSSNAFECPPSRLMRARHLWSRVAQVHIPATKYNVVIHLASEEDYVFPPQLESSPDAAATVEVRLSPGLTLTANSLIFEYAAFHGMGEDEDYENANGGALGGGLLGPGATSLRNVRKKRVCWRCNLPILQGSTCQNCKQNGNQCSRCLFINLSDEEMFLCTKCGSSNFNFMSFTIVARPNYTAVANLRDDEDRETALSCIVTLTEDLNTTSQALSRVQNNLALNIISTDATTVGGPSSQPNSSLAHFTYYALEAECIQLDATIIACRLWALRQAVANYDAGVGDVSVWKAAPGARGNVGGCYRCMLATVMYSTETLLHTMPKLCNFEVLKEFIQRAVAGLRYLSPVVQNKLRHLIVNATQDSVPLIDHLGEVLVDRLRRTADCQGETYELGHLCSQEVALLGSSVQSILPGNANSVAVATSTTNCLQTNPLDQSAACWEARLRPVFRLLFSLTEQPPSSDELPRHPRSPPAPVVQNILFPCIRNLEALAKYVPVSRKSSTSADEGVEEANNMKSGGFHSPSVNFDAWLRGDKESSYSAWRQHYALSMNIAASEARVMKAVEKLGVQEKAKRRDLILAGRYALRWRYKVLRAKLDLNSPSRAVEETPHGSWMTPLLFSSASNAQGSRNQSCCLSLLKTLSLASSSSTNRAAESLCYLSSECVPYLDRLVYLRGSAFSDDFRIQPVVSTMWELSGGSALGLVPKIARARGNVAIMRPAVVPSDSSRPLPMRPLLLLKAKLLDRLDPLLTRTLATMSSIEGAGSLLPTGQRWTECVPPQLSPTSGTGALPGVNPACVLLHTSDLLRLLQPLNDLGPEYQNQLVRFLLHITVNLRPLVYQRSAYTSKAESVYKAMLDQLSGLAGSRTRDYLKVVLDFLAQYPVDANHNAIVFLLEQLCAPVCPIETEIPPFPVRLSVWRDQEEYLFVRRIREVVMSNTRGFGPTISDVINYICTENNLTTDMRLEMVCENQILMPQLLLRDVYTHIWLANPNNANAVMELVYRIPGLEEDNLPYVETIPHPPIPPEQYSHLVVLAEHPHGLAGILNRLATVNDALKCCDLLHVSVHLLEYCLKVPQCQARLVDPQYRAIPILLEVLSACLHVIRLPAGHCHAQFHDQVTSRLVRVLTALLRGATSLGSDAGPLLLPRLLNCIASQSDLAVVHSGVARLPGLLALGEASRMNAIVDFLRQHAVRRLEAHEVGNADLMQCCCALVTGIPNETLDGRRLRAKLVTDLGLLSLCVNYLWELIPAKVLALSEEAALDTKDPDLECFLSDNALPFVLQLMRGCVWTVGHGTDDPIPPAFPAAPSGCTTRQLLAFLHKLETSKSAGRVGLLAEDLLDEWVGTVKEGEAEGGGTDVDPQSLAGVVSTVRELRRLTVQRNRRIAREVRQRQLLSLNMKINEKGQVAMSASDKLAEMTAQVVEETGLQCAICHGGPRSAPQEELAIYVFIRRCPLEEGLSTTPSTSSRSTPGKSGAPPSTTDSEGFTTVSSFVVVHFECHVKAIRASNQSEWTVASRHNRDARCNCLIPILMGGTQANQGEDDLRTNLDELFAKRMSSYAMNIMSLVSLPISTKLVFHDIKLLLLRFAHQRPFHSETGGGARESNMNLVPHLMQIAIFELNKEQTVVAEQSNLMHLIVRPETYWSTDPGACWDPLGPLYSIVAALHLLTPKEWRKHRANLLRHLMGLAYARATTTDNSVSVEFSIYKPYLLFFGLIQSFYEHLFKDVVADSGEPNAWPKALSDYIRCSDEQLISSTPKLLSFFEGSLSPIESVAEFLNVVEMTGEVNADELTQLATTGRRAEAAGASD